MSAWRAGSLIVIGAWCAIVVIMPAAARERADAAATAGSLSWMAGSWSGSSQGVAMEEHWTSPGGGTLLGMHRDVSKGRTVSFEFLRIEEQDGRLVYLASPRGAPATPFVAAEIGPRRAVFENKAHDFPQRVIYWRDGADLCARIEGTLQGKNAAEEWRWSPASLGSGRP